jgi:hypothetical protein
MKKLEKKPYIAIVLIVMLTISATAIMMSNASAGTTRKYCATISPTDVDCGETVTFTVTFTNDASSEDDIGSIRIYIGSEWTGVTTPIVTATNPAGLSWTGSLNGNDPRLNAVNSSQELDAGESVTATFNATAPSSLSGCGGYYGCFTWDLDVYDNRDWTSDYNHPKFDTASGCSGDFTVCVTCITCTTATETTTEWDTTTETTTETFSDCTITSGTVTETTTEWDTTTETTTETFSDCIITSGTVTETTTQWDTTTETTTEIQECEGGCPDNRGSTGVSLFAEIRCENPTIIVGGTSEVDLWRKPVGTTYAFFIDATGATLLWGLCQDGTLYWDIDPTAVNQATGQSLINGHEIRSGGPVVNGPVHYDEATKNSPVYYKPVSGKGTFWTTQGTPGTGDDAQISGAQLSFAELGPSKDMFIVQLYQKPGSDPAKYVLEIYGLEGRGTLAGAVWFKTVVEPNLESFTDGYYVVQWADGNNNGHPDVPPTDTYTIVAQGTVP